MGTRVILPDKQVETLDKHDIYFPKGNILHIIFIVDIFGKAIFGRMVKKLCFQNKNLTFAETNELR